jgi:hypothetical protein
MRVVWLLLVIFLLEFILQLFRIYKEWRRYDRQRRRERWLDLIDIQDQKKEREWKRETLL